ncbi:hypothetical protein XCR_3191 [Xanthomonas campestris pv. raphani 756C]|nr:hypothetical protein XCR_3191 [Xanthomonas campestris pv. raphani 756C]
MASSARIACSIRMETHGAVHALHSTPKMGRDSVVDLRLPRVAIARAYARSIEFTTRQWRGIRLSVR